MSERTSDDDAPFAQLYGLGPDMKMMTAGSTSNVYRGPIVSVCALEAKLFAFQQALSVWLDDDENLKNFDPLNKWLEVTSEMARIERESKSTT